MTTPTIAPGPRWRKQPSGDALVSLVARALGVQWTTASTYLYGEQARNEQVAVIVRCFRAAGRPESLAHWLAPIDAAIADAQVEPLGLEVLTAEQEADGAEDVAQTIMLAHPSPHTRGAFVRRARASIAQLERLVRAVEALGIA
jgi:hypothetical protein